MWNKVSILIKWKKKKDLAEPLDLLRIAGENINVQPHWQTGSYLQSRARSFTPRFPSSGNTSIHSLKDINNAWETNQSRKMLAEWIKSYSRTLWNLSRSLSNPRVDSHHGTHCSWVYTVFWVPCSALGIQGWVRVPFRSQETLVFALCSRKFGWMHVTVSGQPWFIFYNSLVR